MDNRGTLEQDTVGLGNCLVFEDLAHLDHFWRQWLPFYRNNSLSQNSAFWQSIIRTEVKKRPLDHCNRFQVQKHKKCQKHQYNVEGRKEPSQRTDTTGLKTCYKLQ